MNIVGSLDDFVERLRVDVEKEYGRPVYKKPLKSKYNLHKHKIYPTGVFAHICKRVTLHRFNISANEKRAIQAGVADSADKRAPSGDFAHEKAALIWYVREGNAESYRRAVRALSKMCQVR